MLPIAITFNLLLPVLLTVLFPVSLPVLLPVLFPYSLYPYQKQQRTILLVDN